MSTVLEVYFDRTPRMFQPFERYVSTVLEVVSTEFDVYFGCARGVFRPCSKFVWTELN